MTEQKKHVSASAQNFSESDAEREKKLNPYIKKLKLLSALQRTGLVAIILAVILMAFLKQMAAGAILLVIGAGLLAVSLLLYNRTHAEYESTFRQEMGPELEEMISSYIGPQLETDLSSAKARIEQEIRNSGLCENFDSCKADSYRKGKRGELTFEAFNAVLSKTVEVVRKDTDGGNVKNKEEEKRFDGIFLIAELKRGIPSPIVIVERKAGRTDSRTGISVGDETFDRKYEVHCDDPVAARGILTHRLTDQLMNFSDRADAECGFCFAGRKLYIAIGDGPRFLSMEGASMQHIADLRRNMKASLEYLCGLLDLLAENRDLFGEIVLKEIEREEI